MQLFVRFFVCSNDYKDKISIADGGSGTGAGNPVIVGKVYKENGDPVIFVFIYQNHYPANLFT
jgi:hypothetical protein